MRITVISGARRCGVDCADGEDLLSVLRKNGFLLPAGCGGRGTCGKCRVRVSGGRYGVRGREVLACRTPAEEGLRVRVGQYRGGGLTEGLSAPFACDGEEGVGLAVDIGTTTVAFALCDLADGKILEKYACLNSQSGFGADVISRIRAAETGSAGALRDAIRGQVGEALGALRKKYGLHSVKKVAVCGNTAMLHFFCGEDASGIGRAPFTPAFTEYRSYAGAELGLEAEEVQVLPSVSAFVGADVTAGCIAVGLDREEGMLADIGTNGEMFAHAQGRMLCTSAAAGPCFEGANIECGMGGVDGAIDSVRAEGTASPVRRSATRVRAASAARGWSTPSRCLRSGASLTKRAPLRRGTGSRSRRACISRREIYAIFSSQRAPCARRSPFWRGGRGCRPPKCGCTLRAGWAFT